MSFFKSKNFKKEKKTDKMFEVVDSTDKGKIVKTDLSALDDEKRLEFKKIIRNALQFPIHEHLKDEDYVK